MHAGLDEIGHEPSEHIGENASLRIDRRNQIGENAVESGHEFNP
jgi:hypothetical protein